LQKIISIPIVKNCEEEVRWDEIAQGTGRRAKWKKV